MSYGKTFGKDRVMFVTKEDHSEKSKIVLPEIESPPGLLLPTGDINWNCPCLGGMATGPCGVEFREAFSCFHYSEADPKGSDCYDAFKTMQVSQIEAPAGLIVLTNRVIYFRIACQNIQQSTIKITTKTLQAWASILKTIWTNTVNFIQSTPMLMKKRRMRKVSRL